MHADLHKLRFSILYASSFISLCLILGMNSSFVSASSEQLAAEISPAHNYQLAADIVDRLQTLRQIRHITTPIEATPRNSNTTPSDVYQNSYTLLEKLSRLASQLSSQLVIPSRKAISMVDAFPKKLTGRKIPADSHKLLLQAKHLTNKLLENHVHNYPLLEAGFAPGMTPPDVDKLLNKAILLTGSLL